MRTFPRLSAKPNAAGSYEICWSEMDDAGSWRSKRRSTKTGQREVAEERLAAFLTAPEQVKDRKKVTLAEVFEVYLRQHSLPNGNEVSDRKNMTAPLQAFGDWPALAITSGDVENYARRRANGAYGRTYGSKGTRPVAAATVRRDLVALQAVLNFGSRADLIPGKPSYRFSKPSDGPPRDLWLTEDQQAEVLKHLPTASLDVRLFVRFGLTYGVRLGAMKELRFGDQVNFITGSINFQPSGKRPSRKRRPVVPMTRTIRADLEEMLTGKKRGDPVLARDTPHQFERFMAQIGFGWVTPHVLKHTAITLMLRAGIRDADVAKMTATDLRTIHKVYRHHSLEELHSLADARGI